MRRLHKTAKILVACASASGVQANAQLRTDGTLGAKQNFVGRDVTIPARLGQQRGGNLFHSFSDFNVAANRRVTFTGQADRVLARVTGGRQSTIDGTLSSQVAGAAVYLINPAGVIIGPNATIDVPGSFVVTTADYLKFDDGSEFYAADPKKGSLTAAAPSAFGFLGKNPGSLTIHGTLLPQATSNDPQTSAVIAVPAVHAISLIGGDVSVVGRGLNAPGGRVTLVATSGAGEVALNAESAADEAIIATAARGNVTMSESASLSVTDSDAVTTDAGAIIVRGGHVTFDAAAVAADTQAFDVPGGRIDVDADTLDVSNGSSITTNSADAPGGGIMINARRVTIDGQSLVASSAFGEAAGGDVSIHGRSQFKIAGGSTVQATTEGPGPGGRVIVRAGELTIDGGNLQDLTTGVISQTGLDVEGRGEGEDSVDGTYDVGRGGDVKIDARAVAILRGGQVSATTIAAGDAGDVHLVADALKIDGVNYAEFTGISVETDSGRVGPFAQPAVAKGGAGGTAHLDVSRLDILRGGGISANTFGDGPGGQVIVTADTLNIDGAGAALDVAAGDRHQTVATGINATSGATGAAVAPITGGGTGGDVTLKVAGVLRVRDATVRTNTNTDAPAGDLAITAGRLEIVRTAASFEGESGVGANVEPGASGAGGGIAVSADSIFVSGGARLSVSTFGPGNAGTMRIDAGNVTVQSRGRIESTSEYLPASNYTNGPLGRGGDVDVRSSGDVTLRTAGTIAAQADSGDAGNIALSLPGLLSISDTDISTEANQAGGNISIGRPSLTSKRATGAVAEPFTAPQFIILGGDSRITANAVNAAGGNIAIDSGLVILSADSRITASSQQSTPGLIDIGGSVVDLTGSLTAIDASLIERGDALRAACGMFGGSSFIVEGQGGVPVTPGLSFGLLP